MNDKDKESFEKWHYENIANPPTLNELINKAWIDACEYKQKEIDELKNVIYWTVEQNGKVTRHISIAEIEKLQAENEKLKKSLNFTIKAAEYLFKPDEKLADGLFPTSYFTLSYEGDLELIEKTKLARQVLKELEEK
jgi:hypothetical protein